MSSLECCDCSSSTESSDSLSESVSQTISEENSVPRVSVMTFQISFASVSLKNGYFSRSSYEHIKWQFCTIVLISDTEMPLVMSIPLYIASSWPCNKLSLYASTFCWSSTLWLSVTVLIWGWKCWGVSVLAEGLIRCFANHPFVTSALQLSLLQSHLSLQLSQQRCWITWDGTETS